MGTLNIRGRDKGVCSFKRGGQFQPRFEHVEGKLLFHNPGFQRTRGVRNTTKPTASGLIAFS